MILVKDLNSPLMQLGGFDKQLQGDCRPSTLQLEFQFTWFETINKLIRVQRQLLQDLGRDPAPEEIGEEMDLPPEKYVKFLKLLKNQYH